MNCKRATQRIICTRSQHRGNWQEKGARVITAANGVFVYDSDGEKILDAMAGLWCVNIGYGREELADVAHRQMKQLPYYNTFFQTTHIPAIELSERIANLAPCGFEPRILCGFWVRGERYEYSHGASLLGDEGQAAKINHHQPQKCLSRVDLLGVGRLAG
jgi:hypothetical protein